MLHHLLTLLNLKKKKKKKQLVQSINIRTATYFCVLLCLYSHWIQCFPQVENLLVRALLVRSMACVMCVGTRHVAVRRAMGIIMTSAFNAHYYTISNYTVIFTIIY